MGKLKQSVQLIPELGVAIKHAQLHRDERRLLRRDDVFARTWHVGDWQIQRLGEPASLCEASRAMVELLSARLWPEPDVHQRPVWRGPLAQHILEVYPSPRLVERVHCLPSPDYDVLIHGDATRANLIKYGDELRWIDPLFRWYVPGDPAVDVGKFWQSCWGYEDVLAGGRADFQRELAHRTAHDCYVELEHAETWLLVHLARLLRYHDERIRRIYTEVLADAYDCRL